MIQHICLIFVSQEIDFNTFPDSMISAAITSSVSNNRVGRKRVMQCIKYKPNFRQIVAWIVCNKGSKLSSSLTTILNSILTPLPVEPGLATAGESSSGCLARVLQVEGLLFLFFTLFWDTLQIYMLC